MTREAELAQLLMQLGAERGLALEQILEELATLPWPTFVDAAAVHTALLGTVESWWRADLEDRLQQLRQQFGQPVAPPESRPEPAATVPGDADLLATIPAAPEPVAPLQSDATIEEPAAAPQDPAEALPDDATMIWTTRG